MGPGDDLLRYLIVPARTSPPDDPPSRSSTSSPPSDPASLSLEEEYWRARGQLQEEPTPPERSPKRRKMEVDTATAVPAAPGQIMSMEEFLAARAEAQAGASPSASGAQPQPRAIAARSSKYTIALHEKYQAYGIPRPDFVFGGGGGGGSEGWSARTEFLGRELVVEGPCGSKQEAKERLSEKALGVMLEMEAAGKLERAAKTKKQKAEQVQPEVVRKEKEAVVNYVGLLLEFQRSVGGDQPTYTDYQLGQSFSCEVTLAAHTAPFGSRTTYFSSKKAARQHAAGCAVQHLQAAGLWPESSTDAGGIKKKKSPTPTATPTSLDSSTSADNLNIGASSFAHRVAHLATALGLPTPEWRYTPSAPTSAPGFHTVTCYFKNGGPHEGPLGEVRHVFGKKKAKEECARLVLQYLEGVRDKRLENARAVMNGVAGAAVESVVMRGVGKPGGDELVGAGKGGEVRGYASSEDGGFESASEHLG